MCYILLAINQRKEYPFILAANRDEFYQRASSQLAFWEDKPHIAGGRDLEQGGTWMGVTKTGHFAAITNYREAATSRASLRSRGLLITDYLDSNININSFSDKLQAQADTYSGYNLIYGNLPNQLYYFSNRNNRKPQPLAAGIYALSNHLLDTPWPKVKSGKQNFEKIIKNPKSKLNPLLFQLLSDQTTADSDQLPNTGIDGKFEKLLSSIFIKSDHYGTRCSSILTVDQFGQISFTELTHNRIDKGANNPITLQFDL